MSDDRAEWLIRKGIYFYRPNKQGYTTSKFEAGRYTKADADAEASIEPWHMFALHESEVPDNHPSAIVDAKDAEIASLTHQAESLERVSRMRLDRAVAAERELAEIKAERDAPSDRLEIGSPEWHEDMHNCVDHNHWSHGLIEPTPERQRELVNWAEMRLFSDGWRWAKDLASERRQREVAERRIEALTAENERMLAALRKHHEWHQTAGVWSFQHEDGPVEIDLSAEYSDSSLHDDTLAALAKEQS